MTESRDGGRAGDRIERLYLALRSIREVDRLLIKVKDRSKLLDEICRALVRNRGYYNAWIVLLDDGNSVVEVAEAGLGREFAPMRRRMQRGEFTHCSRRALAEPGVVVVEDPYVACADCPLSQKYGGRSAMTVRLEYEGKVFGLLCVSIPRPYAGDAEETRLLDEIAGDIAFGLNKIALEVAVRQNEERFRDLVESSPTGILIVRDGKVVYRNPALRGIVGSHPRVGERIDFRGVVPEDREAVRAAYDRVAGGVERSTDLQFRFYIGGGGAEHEGVKWVYTHATAIEYGGKDAVLINMIDVTRAKELEHMVLVEDKMASLGHIAAGIAHEIRNPLSGINIYLNALENLLGESDQPETTRKILSQIKSASRKIESVVKRVIDFSKPSVPMLVTTDINRPVDEAIALSSVALRKSGVKIERVAGENLPPCCIDPTMIEEVVLNMITNSAEAMKGRSGEKLIEVASDADDHHVIIRISDSGPGVPAALRKKIFEPFYTTKKSGTGIGLSLCSRIVKDHGGSISVGVSKWSGAEFTIRIPAVGRK